MRWITFFFFLLVMPVFAQYNSFICLSIEDGLSHSQVNDVHQDATGHLWVATVSGLSRYDGTEVRNYYKSDGLVDNLVTYILETDNGTLYFGGLGGFTSYYQGEFIAFPFPEGIVDSRVQFLDVGSNRKLWIATNRDGYFSYDFAKAQYGIPIIELGTNIRYLNIEAGHIAGREGLYKDGELFDPIFEGVSVSDLVIHGDSLWVATLGEGLYLYSDRWTHFSPEEYPELSYTRDIHRSTQGDIWLAGPEGAVRGDASGWSIIDDTNGLPYINLRHVDEDREGNIWLSSNGQGLFRYTSGLFSAYRKGSPLHSELMLSATERFGDLYLGMFDDSLQVLHQDAKATVDSSLLSTDVWAQVTDSKDRIWAGTSSGLYRSEPGEPFMEVFAEELPSNRITSLFEDAYGNMWIGHREGVTVSYTDKELQHYTEEQGFEGKRVRSIVQASDGALWLGAQNGLFRIDEDWILRLSEDEGLNDNTIYSIQEDGLGRLWVGAKNGLHILKDDSVLQVMISGRVDANNINFLLVSQKGYLYVGSNQGFFAAEILDDVASMEFEQFGIEDGLPGLECNMNAVYQDGQGDIWFGTNRGVVMFDEQNLISRRGETVPHLRLDAILLFAEKFDMSSRSQGLHAESGLPIDLTFRPYEDHITFSFKGVRLKDAKRIAYQYFLEGVDDSWLPASTARSVTYSSLPFGSLVFKVRCVDSTGEVLGQIIELPFRIQPPLILRWWAILIQLGLLIGLLFATSRWRAQVSARKNNLIELGYRNRMQSLEQASLNSSMNRHFIFNSLNAIQFYINREDKRAANKYLSSFARLIRKNLDSTTTAWVSLADELERLELYLSLEHMRFKDKFSYELEVDSRLDTSAVQVPAMMLQPFVENSIWHGILPKNAPGQVVVSVNLLQDRLRIRIEDDGIGIDESRAMKNGSLPDHESKGMDITHHRLRLYGEMTGTDFEVIGPVQLEETGEVKGTRIDLFIPQV